MGNYQKTQMELPRAEWLKPYSWSIITVSTIETVMMAPGNLMEKMALSAFSCIMVVVGFIISCCIINSYAGWLKLARRTVEYRYRQNIIDMAILLFYFGALSSGIMVFIYPIMKVQPISFSMSPMGIGFLLGARWIGARYNPSEKSKLNNIR